MGFCTRSALDQKLEFVRLAEAGGVGVAELCRRFGIGRTCGHKWLALYRREGEAGLAERSRRPLASPRRAAPAVETAVLGERAAHPAWGGRKIARVLAREREIRVAPSTVTGILRRHGVPLGPARAEPPLRFEAEAANLLWQMDFKGHVALATAGRLHPLTVLDDHSRYVLAVAACGDGRETTVKAELARIFRRYGLPRRMLVANGSPWGTAAQGRFSALAVWLIERGIAVSHARPLHPQTLGEDERFHRTLKAELLGGPPFADLAARAALERWRRGNNARRPHEALGGAVPLERYTPLPRPFPEAIVPFEYPPGDLLRKVQPNGRIKLAGLHRRVGRAFAGKIVALREGAADAAYEVWFRHQCIGVLDLRAGEALP